MFFKQVKLGTLFLTCFVLLTEANQTKCPLSEQLRKCACIKSTTSEGTKVTMKCMGATTDDIQKDFFTLLPNGDIYYQLEISESDLDGFTQLPEHIQPSILKFVDVKNLQIEKLKEIIRSVPDLTELILDRVPIPKITRDLFGEKHNLLILTLNGNGIQEIADDAFQHFHSLKTLSLENNKLDKLPKAVLTTPVQQISLNLNGNPITQLDKEELKKINDRQTGIFLDSVDCVCTNKDTPLMQWAKETKPDNILCSSPEKFKDTKVGTFVEDQCSGADGPILLSSLLLVAALYISHLLN